MIKETSSKPSKAHQSNLSSEKLLALIEYLSRQPKPCRLNDLSAALDMPASTILRFLRVLHNTGYVMQDADTGRYALTLKLCSIGDNIREHYRLTEACRPYLQQMVELFGESANLAIENDMMVTYIDVIHNPNRSLLSLKHIGGIAPLHCTGVGKLLLLEYSNLQLDALIATKGLPAFTPHTITTKEDLVKELNLIRARGYSHDSEECEIGVRCVAAPVYNNMGRIIAGISVSGPVMRMTRELINQKLPEFLQIAFSCSQRMGWQMTI